MLGGPVALILTFHEGALVVAAALAVVSALLAALLSRGAGRATKALVALGVFAATLVLGYEVLTRSIDVDGLSVEVVRTNAGPS